jgi:uncharacterized damage-inducible protein DinB
MDKATFISTLKEARAEWEALLAQIDEACMNQPGATGKWSVKDVIAHVAWSELEMVPLLNTHSLADASELWNLSEDERNEIVYQQNRDRSLRDVVNEERKAYADMLAAIESLSDEALNDPGRFKGMPQDWIPWRIVDGCSSRHYRDHAAQLREWLAHES